jgi:hypothetical protein
LCANAGVVGGHGLVDGFAEVVPEMPAICYLDRLRRTDPSAFKW